MGTTTSSPVRYGAAVLAVVVGVAVLFTPGIGQGLTSVLFLAVLVSALFGGMGPGLLATGLVAATAVVLFIGSREPIPPFRVVGLCVFVAGGVLITLLVEALHAARRRAEESEAQVRLVTDALPVLIAYIDADRRYRYNNREYERWWGVPRDALRGKTVREVVGADNYPPVAGPIEEALRGRGQAFEARVRFPVAGERDVQVTYVPHAGEDGAVKGFFSLVEDVTERKQAELELREAARRKDEFLAMLAHELRNPLSAISGAVQLARRNGWQHHQGWTEEVLDRQVRNLSRLIDDLLDVARVSRGAVRLRTEVLELAPVLRAAEASARPLVDERRHRLEVSAPEEGLRVNGDPTRLEQVVVNLLTNAARYTEPGGRIDLSARREGAEAVVTVKDNGKGIPPGQLAKVFELFVQGDRSLARSEGGLGIGLTLVRSLVAMHGGTVTARSDGPGLGSEFTVRLPAVDEPADRPAPRPAATTDAAEPPGKARRRVLVVDDNVDSARGLSRLLGRLGHEVRTCHDGPSAVDAAGESNPDVVLLDIGLPGMDGYEVARRLRETGHLDALIIAVTGYGQDDDRRRSKGAGIDHHLIKPVDHDELLGLIARPETRGP
jgi:PAS domain S-box-containing protein